MGRKSFSSIAAFMPGLFLCLQAYANGPDASPTITSLTPYYSKIGDTVIITGTDFDSSSILNNKVSFTNSWYVSPGVFQYDTIEAEIIAVTGTTLTVTVPSGATNGRISVSVNGEYAFSENGVHYSIIPTIESFVPDNASVGDTITITGTGFDSWHPWSMFVWFTNGNNTNAISGTTTSCKVVVPLGSTTGPITIFSNSPKTVSSFNFNVLPKVTFLNTDQGEVGGGVTVYGSGFDPAQIANYQVIFNGIPAPARFVSSTSIDTNVPRHASTGPVVVTFNGTVITGPDLYFIVNPTQPDINSYSVYSGIVGTPVTITGSGFDQFGGPPVVSFGGAKAEIADYNENTIHTAVPLGAASGPISVVVAGLSTYGYNLSFRVLEKITSMGPTHARVGDTILVKGTGFFPYLRDVYYSVHFDNVAANVTSVTDTSLAFVLPQNARSGNPVIYSNYNLNVIIKLPYVGIIPTISSITPDTVISGRSQIITVRGTGYSSAIQASRFQVVFTGNSIQKNLTEVTPTSLQTTVPKSAKSGPVTIVLDSLSSTTSFDLVVLPDTFPYKPNPPLMLSPKSVTTRSFIGMWGTPYRALGYLLDVSADNFATTLPGYKAVSTTDTTKLVTGLSAGTVYQIRVRAYSDTDTSDYSFQSIVTLPEPPVAKAPYRSPPNNFFATWSHARGAEGYQVEVSDNNFTTFISGIVTDTVVLVLVSPLNRAPSFQYKVRAFNSSGYSQYSNTIVMLVTEAGDTGDGIVLYPNPANDFITVAGIREAILETVVVDALGKSTPVRLQKAGDNKFMLDVRPLSEGLYVLQIITHRGVSQMRLMIGNR